MPTSRRLACVLLGLDAFDPRIFEDLYNRGALPHLGRLLEAGGYARLDVANPPQSEVSWTSLATGLDPGDFGLFDFVHRDPATYAVYPSLLPTARRWYGTRFVAPHRAYTLFDFAAEQGYPSTRLWWPATFPPDEASPVRTVAGLGTPDVLGRLGAGVCLSVEPGDGAGRKTRLGRLDRIGTGRYRGRLPGPWKKAGDNPLAAEVEVELETVDASLVRLRVGSTLLELEPGSWSSILEIRFPMRMGAAVHAVSRAIVRDEGQGPFVYFLPLQIHPLHPIWAFGAPASLAPSLWHRHGPYLSLGWPQDTTGLEEGFLTPQQFLDLCDSIYGFRRSVLLAEVERFSEGVLAAVFDSLDRIQHMFWVGGEDRIHAWYRRLDGLVGEVLSRLAPRRHTRLLVTSDHGFGEFRTKVDVNRWLIQQGHLSTSPGANGSLRQVDWGRTSAYSLGLNSLYLNLAGREGRGSLDPTRRRPLAEELRRQLLSWTDPDGRHVLSSVWLADETFRGPFADRGPDLVLGFNQGFRGSAENGLGEWTAEALRANRDRWSGDHCFDPQWVPGVLFSSEPLWHTPAPTFRDLPQLAVGMEPRPSAAPPAPLQPLSEREREVLEERLRDLGYL